MDEILQIKGWMKHRSSNITDLRLQKFLLFRLRPSLLPLERADFRPAPEFRHERASWAPCSRQKPPLHTWTSGIRRLPRSSSDIASPSRCTCGDRRTDPRAEPSASWATVADKGPSGPQLRRPQRRLVWSPGSVATPPGWPSYLDSSAKRAGTFPAGLWVSTKPPSAERGRNWRRNGSC